VSRPGSNRNVANDPTPTCRYVASEGGAGYLCLIRERALLTHDVQSFSRRL